MLTDTIDVSQLIMTSTGEKCLLERAVLIGLLVLTKEMNYKGVMLCIAS